MIRFIKRNKKKRIPLIKGKTPMEEIGKKIAEAMVANINKQIDTFDKTN